MDQVYFNPIQKYCLRKEFEGNEVLYMINEISKWGIQEKMENSNNSYVKGSTFSVLCGGIGEKAVADMLGVYGNSEYNKYGDIEKDLTFPIGSNEIQIEVKTSLPKPWINPVNYVMVEKDGKRFEINKKAIYICCNMDYFEPERVKTKHTEYINKLITLEDFIDYVNNISEQEFKCSITIIGFMLGKSVCLLPDVFSPKYRNIKNKEIYWQNTKSIVKLWYYLKHGKKYQENTFDPEKSLFC